MIVVFLGPTLDTQAASRILEAEYRPPAARGDIARVVDGRTTAIGLVDGAFEDVPAVQHREILWALSRGIRVYGAASMGALRAVELESFGMQGVGWIFQAYRQGLLEADDEVSVAHGPSELGYPVVSEAMVNIRRTLERAEAQDVISQHGKDTLIALAKQIFYKDRSFVRVLEIASHAALVAHELAALRAWLPHGAINQKRLDAIALLEVMKADLKGGVPWTKPRFTFRPTTQWRDLQRECAVRAMEAEEERSEKTEPEPDIGLTR